MSIEIFLLPSLFLFLLLIFCRQRQNHRRLPPSPPSIPILGHLHLFNLPIHRSLAAISAAHGPVVLLHFGSRPVLLVSSPSTVEECFTVLDVAFANRPRFLAGKILGYDFTAILRTPYGSHWRRLRHITSMHLLAFDSLRVSSDLRSGEIRALARNLFLQQGGGSGGAPRRLDLKSTLFDLVCAIIEQLVVPLTGETQEQRLIVREMVSEGLQLSAATANAGDDMPEFMRVA
ncbi:isoflavone 2'-hydroxylase-like [Zingiber officinale]|uniref:isoflavone 2'-hydroxylase-like n=1 Tax=Zingiber officinale TaxID=94328 RepID=UPI001C4C74F2|nr:isoflavone 2'-hydroxylase-like [Zingiber officinale]